MLFQFVRVWVARTSGRVSTLVSETGDLEAFTQLFIRQRGLLTDTDELRRAQVCSAK